MIPRWPAALLLLPALAACADAPVLSSRSPNDPASPSARASRWVPVPPIDAEAVGSPASAPPPDPHEHHRHHAPAPAPAGSAPEGAPGGTP
jgi:hypothetical protein